MPFNRIPHTAGQLGKVVPHNQEMADEMAMAGIVRYGI